LDGKQTLTQRQSRECGISSEATALAEPAVSAALGISTIAVFTYNEIKTAIVHSTG